MPVSNFCCLGGAAGGPAEVPDQAPRRPRQHHAASSSTPGAPPPNVIVVERPEETDGVPSRLSGSDIQRFRVQVVNITGTSTATSRAGLWRACTLVKGAVPAVFLNMSIASSLAKQWDSEATFLSRSPGRNKISGLKCYTPPSLIMSANETRNVPGGVYFLASFVCERVDISIAQWAKNRAAAPDGRAVSLFDQVLRPRPPPTRAAASGSRGAPWLPKRVLGWGPSPRRPSTEGLDGLGSTRTFSSDVTHDVAVALHRCKILWDLLSHCGFPGVEKVALQVTPPGLLLPLQRVECDCFLVQSVGQLRATLVPPVFVLQGLYPYPLRHPYDGYSMVDWERPDYAQWPKAANVSGTHTLLSPGEVLYVPPGWFLALETPEGHASSVTLHVTPKVLPNGQSPQRLLYVPWDCTMFGHPTKDERINRIARRLEEYAFAHGSDRDAAETLLILAEEVASDIGPEGPPWVFNGSSDSSGASGSHSSSDAASTTAPWADDHVRLFHLAYFALAEAGWLHNLQEFAAEIIDGRLTVDRWARTDLVSEVGLVDPTSPQFVPRGNVRLNSTMVFEALMARSLLETVCTTLAQARGDGQVETAPQVTAVVQEAVIQSRQEQLAVSGELSLARRAHAAAANRHITSARTRSGPLTADFLLSRLMLEGTAAHRDAVAREQQQRQRTFTFTPPAAAAAPVRTGDADAILGALAAGPTAPVAPTASSEVVAAGTGTPEGPGGTSEISFGMSSTTSGGESGGGSVIGASPGDEGPGPG